MNKINDIKGDILETPRLRIVPLSIEQFHLFLCGTDRLENEMKWASSGEILDTHTQKAMEILYQEALLHPDHPYWYTNWQLILKSENKSIGSACFMKEPDEKGQVEIGYGINETYRNKGYMTEAVTRLVQWAFDQENVQSVIAETEIGNYGSQKVLEKAGMQKYRSDKNSIWFKIDNVINKI